MTGNKHDNGVHEIGTDEIRKAYQEDTPGQTVEEYLSQIALVNEEQTENTKKHFSQVFQNPLKGYPYQKEETEEGIEERHSDVMKKRTQSQQKAHQKAMMKSAKKSIKDYDAKNKNKNEESEVEEDRDYKKEYESYHKDPEQIKRRAKRNEARRSLKNSKKLTSDKDVHHKDNNPMNNDKSNLSIVTQNYNRKEPRMRDKLKEKGCLPNAKRK